MNGLKTVLRVEDDPNDVELALDYLYRRGRFAGREPLAEALLDLKLPKVDGLAVLRIVKADPLTRLSHTPRNSEPGPQTRSLRYSTPLCRFPAPLPTRRAP